MDNGVRVGLTWRPELVSWQKAVPAIWGFEKEIAHTLYLFPLHQHVLVWLCAFLHKVCKWYTSTEESKFFLMLFMSDTETVSCYFCIITYLLLLCGTFGREFLLKSRRHFFFSRDSTSSAELIIANQGSSSVQNLFLTQLPVVCERHLTTGLVCDVTRCVRRRITWPMRLAWRSWYALELSSAIKYASRTSPAPNEKIRICPRHLFSIMEVTHFIGWLLTNISFYIRLHSWNVHWHYTNDYM
jgi:hypothetical protein